MAGDVLGPEQRQSNPLIFASVNMPPAPADDLETFLKRQDRSTLVNVLIELANDHEAVQARLTRLQLADRPDELASGFRKTLTAWRRSSRYFSYREAGEFGRTLEAWLGQVERERETAIEAGILPPIEFRAAVFRHTCNSIPTGGSPGRIRCGPLASVIELPEYCKRTPR